MIRALYSSKLAKGGSAFSSEPVKVDENYYFWEEEYDYSSSEDITAYLFWECTIAIFALSLHRMWFFRRSCLIQGKTMLVSCTMLQINPYGNLIFFLCGVYLCTKIIKDVCIFFPHNIGWDDHIHLN